MVRASRYLGILGLFLTRAAASCSPLTFSITTEAENVVFGNLPDPKNATAVKKYFVDSLTQGPNITGTQHTTGTFRISARFCAPPAGVKPLGTLQLLVNGITYNKALWTGFGFPEYDWEAFATRKGYYTLAIDRIGHGESDKPDPFAVTQGPTHVSLLHEVIQLVQSGDCGIPVPDKIAYVGHSYGAALGNHLGLAHPDDVDAYVLMGYSDTINVDVSLLSSLDPAATLFRRFKGVPFGYLTFATEAARTSVLYGGAFDPAVARRDFEKQDTISVGELFSPGLDRVVTPFDGPVFVITGDVDFFFCHVEGPDACGEALRETGRKLYPDAKYEYEVVPNAGHLLTTQKSARGVFKSVHSWLDKVL